LQSCSAPHACCLQSTGMSQRSTKTQPHCHNSTKNNNQPEPTSKSKGVRTRVRLINGSIRRDKQEQERKDKPDDASRRRRIHKLRRRRGRRRPPSAASRGPIGASYYLIRTAASSWRIRKRLLGIWGSTAETSKIAAEPDYQTPPPGLGFILLSFISFVFQTSGPRVPSSFFGLPILF
jgi:hypothetical protein